jgi:hypothetical protein
VLLDIGSILDRIEFNHELMYPHKIAMASEP